MPKKSNTRAPKGNGSVKPRVINGITYYVGRYTISNPGSGKQEQKYIYGKSETEVAQRLRAITHEIDQGIYVEPQKITLEKWLRLWLMDYCIDIKENTRASYTIQVEHNILPYLGKMKLSSIHPTDIQRLIKILSSREKSPLSPKSIKNTYGVLHKALEQAVALKYLPFNPCDGAKLPRVEKKEISPLNEIEIRAFLSAIKDHPNEVLFKVALFTGMREAELMGLTWDRVDFKNGSILVDRQMIHEKQKGGKYKFAPTKTDAVRKITPAPAVIAWLQSWKKAQVAQRLLLGDKWGDNFENLVFTDEFGHHLSNTTLTHQAKRLGMKIGKDGFRFHDLRHSYAVAAIRAGDDMKTVSSNLGHASISITMDIYAAYTEDMARASSQRMETYMQGLGV